MGIWSCLGTNIEEVKESLYQGKSGIGVDQDRLEYGFRSGLTGIVKRPVLKGVLDRRTRMGLSEEAEYAFMASRDAFQMAMRWVSSSATTRRPALWSSQIVSCARSTTRP